MNEQKTEEKKKTETKSRKTIWQRLQDHKPINKATWKTNACRTIAVLNAKVLLNKDIKQYKKHYCGQSYMTVK